MTVEERIAADLRAAGAALDDARERLVDEVDSTLHASTKRRLNHLDSALFGDNTDVTYREASGDSLDLRRAAR